MHAKSSMRLLFTLVLALSPFGLAACDSTPPPSPTPADSSGVNPDMLKNYPTPANKAAK